MCSLSLLVLVVLGFVSLETERDDPRFRFFPLVPLCNGGALKQQNPKKMSSEEIFELKGNTALYDALGLPKTASESDIKRAYYKLAGSLALDGRLCAFAVEGRVGFIHRRKGKK